MGRIQNDLKNDSFTSQNLWNIKINQQMQIVKHEGILDSQSPVCESTFQILKFY